MLGQRRILGLAAALVFVVGACRDGTEPIGPPAELVYEAGDGQESQVAALLDSALVVLVRDASGRPVPGATVTWVPSDGGEADPATSETDGSGLAETLWTLGTAAGEQVMRARISGIPDVVFTASALPGPVAELVSVAGDGDTLVVLSTNPVIVRATDAYGNPISGVNVVWTVTAGNGTVAPGTSTTDGSGDASAVWTLGTTAGQQALRGIASGLSTSLTVQAMPEEPQAVEKAGGDAQLGQPGEALADSLVVLVRDSFGNPMPDMQVAWTVTRGTGTVGPSIATTDAGGRARAAWVLSLAPRSQEVTASVEGLGSVTFTAGFFNLSVEAIHLNQGNQTPDGTIGGVADRAGLLRVIVRASETNVYAPDVLLRLYHGGSLIREERLPAPAVGVPENPDLDQMNHTWNVEMNASEVVSGLQVVAIVDPDSAIEVAGRHDNRYPRGDSVASLNVATFPTLNIMFIPIEATMHGRTGNIHAGNVDVMTGATWRWIPTGAIATTIRTPFTTDADLRTHEGWVEVLQAVQAMRTAENATDEYYHGIIGDFAGIRYGGLAYVLPNPGHPFRSGLSYDRPGAAPGAIAHELGHNLGRYHAPCGGAGNTDSNYPHTNAIIGAPGYDIVEGGLVQSNTRDYMSYCTPRWTSDYTYNAIYNWRRNDPLAASAAGVVAASSPAATGPETTGLLVWGRVGSGGVSLNPAFSLTARPALPERGGPNVLRGTDADGRELFRIDFEGVPLSEGDPSEKHFVYFVPLAESEIDAVSRIEMTTPRGLAVREAAHPAGQPPAAVVDPEVRLSRAGARALRLQWRTEHHPMALVRDRATGRILAMARRGEIEFDAGGLGPERVEVLLSDGVRTRARR